MKILGRLARPWEHVAPGDSHIILGDDADLVLMALVGATEGLYVVNASLNDGDLSLQMPAFSVDAFHRQEVERFVFREAVFPRVGGSAAEAAPLCSSVCALLLCVCTDVCVCCVCVAVCWRLRCAGGCRMGHVVDNG